MTRFLDQLLVGLCIVTALLFLIRRWIKSRRPKTGCSQGCGCNLADKKKDLSAPKNPKTP